MEVIYALCCFSCHHSPLWSENLHLLYTLRYWKGMTRLHWASSLQAENTSSFLYIPASPIHNHPVGPPIGSSPILQFFSGIEGNQNWTQFSSCSLTSSKFSDIIMSVGPLPKFCSCSSEHVCLRCWKGTLLAHLHLALQWQPCIRFLLAQSFSLLRTLWRVALPPGVSTTPSSLVSSVNLVRVHWIHLIY